MPYAVPIATSFSKSSLLHTRCVTAGETSDAKVPPWACIRLRTRPAERCPPKSPVTATVQRSSGRFPIGERRGLERFLFCVAEGVESVCGYDAEVQSHVRQE